MHRLLTALVIGAVLAGATYGAAATLGGLTTPDLGADDAAVESCDTTGVSTAYNTLLDTATFPGAFRVDTVTVGDVDTPSCDGQTITVILTKKVGAASEELSRASRIVPTPAPGPTTQSFPVPDPATPTWTDPTGTSPVADPKAKDVDDIHILITG